MDPISSAGLALAYLFGTLGALCIAADALRLAAALFTLALLTIVLTDWRHNRTDTQQTWTHRDTFLR